MNTELAGQAISAFVIIIGAIWSTGWWVTRLARIRAETAAASGKSLESVRQVELLTAEKDRLDDKVTALEQRIAVLERIATDPAERTAREIDSLRHS